MLYQKVFFLGDGKEEGKLPNNKGRPRRPKVYLLHILLKLTNLPMVLTSGQPTCVAMFDGDMLEIKTSACPFFIALPNILLCGKKFIWLKL